MQVLKHWLHIAHRARQAANFPQGLDCDQAQIKHKLIRRQKQMMNLCFHLM